MKKAIIIVLLLSSSFVSNAQLTAVGIKTGLNYSSAVIDETFTNGGTNWKYATEEAQVAPLFGVFARIKFLPILFQPEILLSDHKTTMRVSSISVDSLQTLRQNRIDIPLLIGFSRKDRLRGFVGPVYTRILENEVTSDEFLHDEVRDIFEDGTWALQFGLGFDMGRVMVDVRYETSLGQITNGVTLGGREYQFDHRNNVLQVSLGWDFIR